MLVDDWLLWGRIASKHHSRFVRGARGQESSGSPRAAGSLIMHCFSNLFFCTTEQVWDLNVVFYCSHAKETTGPDV